MEADITNITKEQCREWGRHCAAEFLSERFNRTLKTLQHVFAITVEERARHDTAVITIKRQCLRMKNVTLPSCDGFTRRVETMMKLLRGYGDGTANFCE